MIHKVVVSLQPIHFGRAICIAFSDGTVQYRDRFTMKEIYSETDVNKIMTLQQVGFEFPQNAPCESSRFPCWERTQLSGKFRSAGGLLADELLLCSDMRRWQDAVEWPAASSGRHGAKPPRWFVWPRDGAERPF